MSKKMSTSPVDLIFGHEDLVRQILLNLPAKQLMKIKCVCKCWLSLISDPHFCYEHNLRNPNPPDLGFYFQKRFPSPAKELFCIPIDGRSHLPPLHFLCDFIIMHSCNGLMLCKNSAKSIYSICNPTTQKCSVLPELFHVNLTSRKIFECLAFEPTKSPHYDVVLLCFTKLGGSKIVIFSSAEKSWKSFSLSDAPGVPATKLIFSKGAVHWLTTKNFHYKLDLNSLELTGYKMPRNPIISRNNVRYFGDCSGRLWLALGGPLTFMCTILEMEWDTGLWAYKHRINFKHIINPHLGYGRPKFFVLSIVKRSICGGLALVLAIPNGFVSYDPVCRTVETLSDFQLSEFKEIPINLSNLSSYTCRFIESLVPI